MLCVFVYKDKVKEGPKWQDAPLQAVVDHISLELLTLHDGYLQMVNNLF